MSLTPDDIAALFTRADGSFLCARWGRPVAPVIFGLADETLAIFRSAIGAALSHAGLPMTETDPESGANWLLFAAKDWDDIAAIPDMDRLTGRPDLPAQMAKANASSYQLFRFDDTGAIRAALGFLILGGPAKESHPAQLAETMAMRALLTWARPITPTPALAALTRAAYAPELPAAATDPSHAYRLAARASFV
ncbi:MAG: hypothetical protein Q4F71_05290 [Paracoccus sp. (in: a-proteobacteria)]|nr:hypothetical protein [Paracoccus sp. (in: a-proteobacteria)]